MEVQSQFIEMVGDPRSNPKGWKIKKLPDIASYSIGLTYKPEQLCEDGTIVLRSGNIQEGEIDLQDLVRVNAPIRDNLWVKEGDILICSRNGSASLVGKVAQIKSIVEPMTYGAFMTIIRSEYSDYLYMYFQSGDFRDQISSGKSSTMNQITQKMLDKIEIPIPNQEVISTLSAILHQSDKSKFVGFKSQFIEMFTNKEYPLQTLKSFAEITTGSTPSKKEQKYWEDGTKPWVSAQDMKDKYVISTEEKLTDFGFAKCKILPIDSLLYVCRGSIGVMAINKIECATNQSICTATCDSNKCHVEFLYNSLLYQKDSVKSIGEGTSFKSLSQSTFANVEIKLPPIAEQMKFVSISEQADKSKLTGHCLICVLNKGISKLIN